MEKALNDARKVLHDELLQMIDRNNEELLNLNSEIDRLVKENFEKSILYEGAKKEIRELRQSNQNMDAVIGIMKDNAELFLEMFEQIYQSDEASFKYEDMEKYVRLGEFMERRYDRKVNIIERVRAKMKELPTNDTHLFI